MGACCAGPAQDGDWDEDELDEVKALIRDRDAAGNPITVALRIEARDLGRPRASLPTNPMFRRDEEQVSLDPFAVVVEERAQQGLGMTATSAGTRDSRPCVAEQIVGRTETKYGTRDPCFESTVNIPYKFEEVQTLTIRFYDEETKIGVLREQGYLGEMCVELAALWAESPYMETIVDVETGVEVGVAVVTATEVKEEAVPEEIVAVFELAHMSDTSRVGRTEPFLTVSRVVDQELVPVAKTQSRLLPQGSRKNPAVLQWPPLHVKVDRLCKGDYSALLVLEVFTKEATTGKHRLIGATQTNLRTLLSQGFKEYELVNDVKREDPLYVRSGVLSVASIQVEQCHSFLDFVRGGFDINLTVAIDFTKSNKPFDSEKSLHYRRSDNRTNEYMAAIQAVGAVMCCYDKDQEFPVYGFGARLPSGQISNCFPCTMMPNNVEVSGLDGIAEVYWSCLKEVDPIEPTHLAHVIRKVSEVARENMEAQTLSYQVLLIITDGAIADKRQTIDAIVAASSLPLSILIVGVGAGADFATMRTLDADDTPLQSSTHEMMQRDIVGFVPFRDYRHLDPDVLARECLREIPRQFTTWTRQNRVKLPDRAPGVTPAILGDAARRKRARTRHLQSDNPDRLPDEQRDGFAQRQEHRQSRANHSLLEGMRGMFGGQHHHHPHGHSSTQPHGDGRAADDTDRHLPHRHRGMGATVSTAGAQSSEDLSHPLLKRTLPDALATTATTDLGSAPSTLAHTKRVTLAPDFVVPDTASPIYGGQQGGRSSSPPGQISGGLLGSSSASPLRERDDKGGSAGVHHHRPPPLEVNLDLL